MDIFRISNFNALADLFLLYLRQRQQGDDWRMIGSCIAGAPPANISIAANDVLSFSLKPGSYDYERLEAGNYRISFTYGIGSIEGPRGEARSPVFAARDCAEN